MQLQYSLQNSAYSRSPQELCQRGSCLRLQHVKRHSRHTPDDWIKQASYCIIQRFQFWAIGASRRAAKEKQKVLSCAAQAPGTSSSWQRQGQSSALLLHCTQPGLGSRVACRTRTNNGHQPHKVPKKTHPSKRQKKEKKKANFLCCCFSIRTLSVVHKSVTG